MKVLFKYGVAMTKYNLVCISIYLLAIVNDCLAHVDGEKVILPHVFILLINCEV